MVNSIPLKKQFVDALVKIGEDSSIAQDKAKKIRLDNVINKIKKEAEIPEISDSGQDIVLFILLLVNEDIISPEQLDKNLGHDEKLKKLVNQCGEHIKLVNELKTKLSSTRRK